MKRLACRLTVALLTFIMGLAAATIRPRPYLPTRAQLTPPPVLQQHPAARCESEETRHLKNATLDSSGSAQHFDQLGDELRARGCFEEATIAYSAALAADASYATAYSDLANTYNFLGWYEEARQTALKGLQVESDHTFLASELGYAYGGLGQYQEAAHAFEQAMRVNPEDAFAHATAAAAYFKLKRYDEAAAEAHRGARLGVQASNDAAIGNAGLALADLGHYEEALRVLQQARQVAPGKPSKYLELGYVYELNGQDAEAHASYMQALGPQPVTPFDYYNRAWAYLYLDDNMAAASAAREYLERVNWQGHDAPYVALLAYIAYRRGNEPGEADWMLAEAAAKCSRQAWPQHLFRYLQHRSTAAELLAAAQTDDDRIDARTCIGLALLFEGRSDEAAAHLKWVCDHAARGDVSYAYMLRQLKHLASTPSY
ncbi:MAG: tetratricopeptide repeat protein [Pyrinomonadaceae bacterium]